MTKLESLVLEIEAYINLGNIDNNVTTSHAFSSERSIGVGLTETRVPYPMLHLYGLHFK